MKKIILIISLFSMLYQPIMGKETDVDAYVFSRTIDPSRPMIALTFDDGPYPKVTRRILNALQMNRCKATFFQLGEKMEKHEDLVVEMVQMGMQIGNHSYSHMIPNGSNTTMCISELKQTETIMKKISGIQTYAIRTPGGAYSEALLAEIQGPMILWSMDTLDWKHQNTEKVVHHVLKNVKDGDIILMHDLYETTAEAVELIIPELLQRGYQLVTVDELFYYKGITLKKHGLYRHA
ncbi:MAG: polysaccharide deacetylase family protein [Erysipelotrichaceae bacterium]|nr:polysaccharide deacetylase family protein [Erysipelotrichaceae bacterium]